MSKLTNYRKTQKKLKFFCIIRPRHCEKKEDKNILCIDLTDNRTFVFCSTFFFLYFRRPFFRRQRPIKHRHRFLPDKVKLPSETNIVLQSVPPVDAAFIPHLDAAALLSVKHFIVDRKQKHLGATHTVWEVKRSFWKRCSENNVSSINNNKDVLSPSCGKGRVKVDRLTFVHRCRTLNDVGECEGAARLQTWVEVVTFLTWCSVVFA